VEDDLVKKFFQSDLTEDEEKLLSERLQTSTEDALRFGQEAEARYARTGLPEPSWPKGAAAEAAVSGASKLLWVHGMLRILAALLGLAIAAVVVFSLWRSFVPSNESQVPALSDSSGHESGSEPTVIVSSSIHKVAAPHPSQTSWVPVLTPVDMDHPSGKPFSSLSITVHKVSEGPVTVEVLTLEGEPLIPLYRGTLKPGNWGFEWDGRLPSGAAAASGYYQIQLDSGPAAAPQKKIIQIQ
jgi:hypothetical protein